MIVSEEFKNNCTSLNLSNNIISSKGVKQIFQFISVQFQKIENLNLSNTKLGDQIIESVLTTLKSRNCQLKNIDLSNNLLSDSSAVKLLEILKSNPHSQLQRINLQGNYISEQCENYINQVTQSLGIANKIKLGCQKNYIQQPIIQYQENYYQDFEQVSKKVNQLWKSYVQKSTKCNVNPSRTIKATIQKILCHEQQEPIQHIVINQTNIGVNEIETIQLLVKQVSSVETLSITNCDLINYSQIHQLNNADQSLNNAYLGSTNNELDLQIIFNKIGEVISDCNNLKNLNLNNLKITSNRMKSLLEFLRHSNKCIRIDFSKNLIDDEGFSTILEYQKIFSDRLQHIIVPFNKLSSRVFGMLLDHLRSQSIANQNVNYSQNNKIQEIVLDGVNCHQNFDIGDFFVALSQFQPKIQNLSLCNIQIKDIHAQKINQFIKNSQYLEDFNLSFNELRDSGAKIIIEGAWSNQCRFSRLSLLGNYFTKQFSSQIQHYQNRHQQKILILIEPTLVNSQIDQHDDHSNFPSQNQIQPMNQIRSSLGAINDEDPDMPIVEHSIKHDQLSNYINGNGQNNITDNSPFLSPSNSPFSKQFDKNMHIQPQQQQQPYSQASSKTSIPNELKNKQSMNQFQSPPSNYQHSVEEFNISPNQQQRSNIDLKSQKDNITFGVNSIGHNNYRLDTDKVIYSNKDQQLNNSKCNTHSGTQLENYQIPVSDNIEGYIRQIHLIESHIKDLFEKQTVLVEEIKQKISQQPQNDVQGLHSQSRQNLSQLPSYKSLQKQSQNNLTERKDGLNSAASRFDSRPQTYQNLPSDSFFNLDDPTYGKAKTHTLFGQYGNGSEYRQINNLLSPQKQVQNAHNNSKGYYSTASNNHLPRTQFSSRDFAIPETQVYSDTQQVAHSLSALQEKIQDLEEKLVIDSHKHLQENGQINSGKNNQKEQVNQLLEKQIYQLFLLNHIQFTEEKVLRSKNNDVSLYQKKVPSHINGSSLNEIPVQFQQGTTVQKTQQTMTSIPTENNISQLAIPQNLNKYSTKYNPQFKNRPNSVQKMPSNSSIQSQLKIPSEDNQDRKQKAHIEAPKDSNLRQSRGVQNGHVEKVKHAQMNRPQSQQKQGPVSMVQMEEVNINVNQSPQKQMIHNEQRINQDQEIQQFLNHQQQLLSQQNYDQGYQLRHPVYEQINESPQEINYKQQIINGSQYSGGLNSQVQTLQSSPYQSGMKSSSIIGNKNLSFSKRKDNVKYLVDELIKSIDRYEYLIQMCSELKQIKKKVHDNIGGNYPYNQINNNNLQKLCGVESDLRDKMRSQERQIYDSINELRDIGLVIDESKLSNWDNLKEILSCAALEYEKNNINKQGDFINYKLSDQIIDKSLQTSLYQNSSHKKNQSYYTQNHQLHS